MAPRGDKEFQEVLGEGDLDLVFSYRTRGHLRKFLAATAKMQAQPLLL